MAKGFGKKTTKKVPKRQTAYLKLVEKLLSCSRGQEEQVLMDNHYLIDTGLVGAITKTAINLAGEGDLDSAEFLIGIGEYLSKELESSTNKFNSM